MDLPPSPQQAQPPSDLRRGAVLARRLVAGVAMTVVVGLLAALLVTFARARNVSHAVATPTPAPLASWSVAPHLGNEPVLPIIAPSDSWVVYEAGVTDLNGEHILRRSDDAGATWHELPVPDGGLGGYRLGHLEIWVDPANAQNVLATLSRNVPEQNQQDCPTLRTAVAFARQGVATSNTPTSAPGNCHLQYFSTDSGAHWTEMRFPIPGSISLGGIHPGDLQSQGTRLFTATHYHGQDPLVRIFASQDRGATWHVADTGLYAPDRTICDFVAAPDSTTLYATTTTSACFQITPQSIITLWRGDDAGAHWTQVGQLPGVATKVIDAFPSAGHADFTLYTVGPGIYVRVWVSEDGGRVWAAAPDPGTVAMFLSDPHDGSLIMIPPPSGSSYSVPQSAPAQLHPEQPTPTTQTPTSAANREVKSWRPRQQSWRPIARSLPRPPDSSYTFTNVYYALVLYSENGGRTLWAGTGSPNANGVGMFYSVRMARLP
jgi:hypothetical protein